MKRLAFIAVSVMISVYFVGCAIGGDSVESQNVDSSNVDSTLTLSNEDYSHLPECKSDEDRIKGCLKIDSYTGKYRSEIPFKNGKVNGTLREYFADETICETQIVDSITVSAGICIDKDGKLKNGTIKEYYDNGNLAFEYTFKDGRKEGVAKLYYENGNLGIEIPHKNGKTEGIRKEYYENGNLHSEVPYKNNNVHGLMKWYYENGNLWRETSYKNGKIDGVQKYYHEDGSLYFSIVYENDKPISW